MPHRLSNTFLRLAVVCALLGMIWGNFMGMTQQYTTATAHTHLNLLGWVSMSLYGLYYRVMPHAAVGRLPQAHLWTSVASLVVMVPAIALVKLEHAPTLALAGPLLGLTAITTLLGMVLFAIIVFKSTSSSASEPVAS